MFKQNEKKRHVQGLLVQKKRALASNDTKKLEQINTKLNVFFKQFLTHEQSSNRL